MCVAQGGFIMNRRGLVAVITLVGAAMSGCLERKEHLTIAPDGGVWYVAQFRTDSLAELYEGDAIPTPAGGWAVEQTVDREDDGKETFKLTATASIPRGGELPSNFAGRGQENETQCLQFPTTVRVEQRADGTYYHIHRKYPARPWVYIQNLQERLVKEPLSELADLDPGEWNDSQRLTVVRALASFEVEKSLVFARAAFLDTTPDAPQDGWLAAQTQMREFVERLDYADLAQLLIPRKDKDAEKARGEVVQAEVERFARLIDEELAKSMRESAGYEPSQVTAFTANYERHKLKYEITQDLQDDKFEVTFTMPGRITAHNAAGSAEGVAGASSITWTFDGPQLNDRAMELMATSVVPHRD
jgi:hypothetical protein